MFQRGGQISDKAVKPKQIWHHRLGFWQNLAKLVLPVVYLAFCICVVGAGLLNMLTAGGSLVN